MSESRFVYVTYIRTTPEKLWQALIDPEFTRQYWVGHLARIAIGNRAARGRLMIPDGRVADSGKVLEIEPERRIVLNGVTNSSPSERPRDTRMTYELEPQGESVKLTVIHEIDHPGSKLINAVSNGWPHILASLKSLLETGESLVETRKWPEGKMNGSVDEAAT